LFLVALAFQAVLSKNYIQKDFLLTPEREYFSLKKVEGIKMPSCWARYFYFSFYYYPVPECASTFKSM